MMSGKRMDRISRRIVGARGLAAIFFVAATICSTGIALANNVVLGSDYFTTLPGTFFNFGPGIGIVPLQGRPLGPGNPPPAGYPTTLGNTDTIVQRQADASLPVQDTGTPSSATIPIQMVALSLESVNPVNVGGSFFNVFVHLDPALPSTGTMTIVHNFLDNGTPAAEGNFTSIFNSINFITDLTPTGGGNPVSTSGSLGPLTGSAPWSHESPPGALLVTGPGNQFANLHSNDNDFFPGPISETHPGGAGLHIVTIATIPEPSTLLLLGSGLAGIAAFGRKRLTKKA